MSKSVSACTHLHPNGRPCGSPALRGEQFCYHHHPSRPASRREREYAASSRAPFALPVLVNRRSVQAALAEVVLRIADNTVDSKRAALLIQCLQIAAATHQA